MKKQEKKEFDYMSVFKKYLELNKQIETMKQSYESRKGNITFAQIKNKELELESLIRSVENVRFVKRDLSAV